MIDQKELDIEDDLPNEIAASWLEWQMFYRSYAIVEYVSEQRINVI